MTSVINNKDWLILGQTFCNLRNDFRNHFYDRIKAVKKTRAFKFYDMYHNHFNKIAINLDNIILNYYPETVSEIDGVNIFDVFFNYHDSNDELKTNIDLKKEIEYFINLITERLKSFIKTNEFRKINRYLKLILKRLNKAIDKGYID